MGSARRCLGTPQRIPSLLESCAGLQFLPIETLDSLRPVVLHVFENTACLASPEFTPRLQNLLTTLRRRSLIPRVAVPRLLTLFTDTPGAPPPPALPTGQEGIISAALREVDATNSLAPDRLSVLMRAYSHVSSQLMGLFGPDTQVLSYGSALNTFGLVDSDLDVVAIIPSAAAVTSAVDRMASGAADAAAPASSSDAPPAFDRGLRSEELPDCPELSRDDVLAAAGACETYFQQRGWEVEVVWRARVPVVSLSRSATNYEGADGTDVSIDITYNHALVIHNSNLLRRYSDLDTTGTTAALGRLVKLWAKRRGLLGARDGFLSSYGWVLLVLHFLQKKRRLLPNLQQPHGQSDNQPQRLIIENGVTHNVWCRHGGPHELRLDPSSPSHSLSSLLLSFFHFISTYDAHRNVVDLQHPNTTTASGGRPPSQGRFRAGRRTAAVADPFEWCRVLFVSFRAQSQILSEASRGIRLLMSGQVDQLFEQTTESPAASPADEDTFHAPERPQATHPRLGGDVPDYYDDQGDVDALYPFSADPNLAVDRPAAAADLSAAAPVWSRPLTDEMQDQMTRRQNQQEMKERLLRAAGTFAMADVLACQGDYHPPSPLQPIPLSFDSFEQYLNCSVEPLLAECRASVAQAIRRLDGASAAYDVKLKSMAKDNERRAKVKEADDMDKYRVLYNPDDKAWKSIDAKKTHKGLQKAFPHASVALFTTAQGSRALLRGSGATIEEGDEGPGESFFAFIMWQRVKNDDSSRLIAHFFPGPRAARLSDESLSWRLYPLNSCTMTDVRVMEALGSGLSRKPVFWQQLSRNIRAMLVEGQQGHHGGPIWTHGAEAIQEALGAWPLINEAQKMAVQEALLRPTGIMPVQGPPGTGKTTFIATFVYFVVSCERPVMVCAATNVAVKHVALKVLQHIEAKRSVGGFQVVPLFRLLLVVSEEDTEKSIEFDSPLSLIHLNHRKKRLKRVAKYWWRDDPTSSLQMVDRSWDDLCAIMDEGSTVWMSGDGDDGELYRMADRLLEWASAEGGDVREAFISCIEQLKDTLSKQVETYQAHLPPIPGHTQWWRARDTLERMKEAITAFHSIVSTLFRLLEESPLVNDLFNGMNRALRKLQRIGASASDGPTSHTPAPSFAAVVQTDIHHIIDGPIVGELKRRFHNLHRQAAAVRNEGLAVKNTPSDDIRGLLTVGTHAVFCTSSVSGRFRLQQLGIDTLIVDEAAQVKESESLIPLTRSVCRLFVVGDPRQLGQTVKCDECKVAGLQRSLFERVTSPLRGEQQGGLSPIHDPTRAKPIMLNVQYRMHPEIAEWPNQTFSQRRLMNGENVLRIGEREGELWDADEIDEQILDDKRFGPLAFFDTTGLPGVWEKTENSSKKNETEINFVIEHLTSLLKHFRPRRSVSIGVVTPYGAQKRAFHQAIQQSASQLGRLAKRITVNSVDGFQGDERDIIVLSCVRANGDRNVGFTGDKKRLNVALTRARHRLWVVGHKDTLSNHPLWASFIRHCEAKRVVFPAVPGPSAQAVQMRLRQQLGAIASSAQRLHNPSPAEAAAAAPPQPNAAHAFQFHRLNIARPAQSHSPLPPARPAAPAHHRMMHRRIPDCDEDEDYMDDTVLSDDDDDAMSICTSVAPRPPQPQPSLPPRPQVQRQERATRLVRRDSPASSSVASPPPQHVHVPQPHSPPAAAAAAPAPAPARCGGSFDSDLDVLDGLASSPSDDLPPVPSAAPAVVNQEGPSVERERAGERERPHERRGEREKADEPKWEISVSAAFLARVNGMRQESRRWIEKKIIQLIKGHFPTSAHEGASGSGKELWELAVEAWRCNKNASLIWWVRIDDTLEYQQTILVFDLVPTQDVQATLKRASRHLKTFSDEYLHRCRLRRGKKGGPYLPKCFRDDFVIKRLPFRRQRELGGGRVAFEVEEVDSTAANTSVSLTKMYEMDQVLLHRLAEKTLTDIELPLKLSAQEHVVVRAPAPLFVLGRSGTGKTLCLVKRLVIAHQRLLQEASNSVRPAGAHNRVLVLCTASPKLAAEIQLHYTRLHNYIEAVGTSREQEIMDEGVVTSDPNAPGKDAAAAELKDFGAAEDCSVLILSFQQFLKLLDTSTAGQRCFRTMTIEDQLRRGAHLSQQQRRRAGATAAADEDDEDEEIDEDVDDLMLNDLTTEDPLARSGRYFEEDEMTFDDFMLGGWWRKLASALGGSDISPLTFFKEILTVIKGSKPVAKRILSGKETNAWLTRGEYECGVVDKERIKESSIEDQNARRCVYDAFERYEKLLRVHGRHDAANVARQLLIRLRDSGEGLRQLVDVRGVMIDEVQDLLPIQMLIFRYLTSNPTHFAFAGDTAQTIAKGREFRFESIKSLFYEMFVPEVIKNTPQWKQQYSQALKFLSKNYRSSKGVIELAASVIDLLVHMFPEKIDRLEREESMEDNHLLPVVITEMELADAFKLLFNKPASQAASSSSSSPPPPATRNPLAGPQFGSQQALLVRTDATRQQLEQHFPSSIILTIEESKGLEFDDVLLVNFFADTQDIHRPHSAASSANVWSVVYAFIQDVYPDATVDPSILKRVCGKFDASRDALLCSLLKELYVAITRARKRVWIIDSSDDHVGPMLYYWDQMKLVNNVHSKEDLGMQEAFARESTEEEWCERAMNFLRADRFDSARISFSNAKEPQMARLAEVLHKIRLTSKKNKKREMAIPAGELKALHRAVTQAPTDSADFALIRQYLHAEKEGGTKWLLREAGDLFVESGHVSEAAEAYRGCEIYDKAAICYENDNAWLSAGVMWEAHVKVTHDRAHAKRALDSYAKVKKMEEGLQLCEWLEGSGIPDVRPMVERFAQRIFRTAAREADQPSRGGRGRRGGAAAVHRPKQSQMYERSAALLPLNVRCEILLQANRQVRPHINVLVEQGRFSEAADLCLMGGEEQRAITMLQQDPERLHRVLMAKLCGFLNTTGAMAVFTGRQSTKTQVATLVSDLKDAQQARNRPQNEHQQQQQESFDEMLIGVLDSTRESAKKFFGKGAHMLLKAIRKTHYQRLIETDVHQRATCLSWLLFLQELGASCLVHYRDEYSKDGKLQDAFKLQSGLNAACDKHVFSPEDPSLCHMSACLKNRRPIPIAIQQSVELMTGRVRVKDVSGNEMLVKVAEEGTSSVSLHDVVPLLSSFLHKKLVSGLCRRLDTAVDGLKRMQPCWSFHMQKKCRARSQGCPYQHMEQEPDIGAVVGDVNSLLATLKAVRVNLEAAEMRRAMQDDASMVELQREYTAKAAQVHSFLCNEVLMPTFAPCGLLRMAAINHCLPLDELIKTEINDLLAAERSDAIAHKVGSVCRIASLVGYHGMDTVEIVLRNNMMSDNRDATWLFFSSVWWEGNAFYKSDDVEHVRHCYAEIVWSAEQAIRAMTPQTYVQDFHPLTISLDPHTLLWFCERLVCFAGALFSDMNNLLLPQSMAVDFMRRCPPCLIESACTLQYEKPHLVNGLAHRALYGVIDFISHILHPRFRDKLTRWLDNFGTRRGAFVHRAICVMLTAGGCHTSLSRQRNAIQRSFHGWAGGGRWHEVRRLLHGLPAVIQQNDESLHHRMTALVLDPLPDKQAHGTRGPLSFDRQTPYLHSVLHDLDDSFVLLKRSDTIRAPFGWPGPRYTSGFFSHSSFDASGNPSTHLTRVTWKPPRAEVVVFRRQDGRLHCDTSAFLARFTPKQQQASQATTTSRPAAADNDGSSPRSSYADTQAAEDGSPTAATGGASPSNRGPEGLEEDERDAEGGEGAVNDAQLEQGANVEDSRLNLSMRMVLRLKATLRAARTRLMMNKLDDETFIRFDAERWIKAEKDKANDGSPDGAAESFGEVYLGEGVSFLIACHRRLASAETMKKKLQSLETAARLSDEVSDAINEAWEALTAYKLMMEEARRGVYMQQQPIGQLREALRTFDNQHKEVQLEGALPRLDGHVRASRQQQEETFQALIARCKDAVSAVDGIS
ncbi:unnamed protein product [Vitrella brassicaformis CCMP3155]|uniref:Polynucleotide adenylyltransferase n=4 Tax=Vitrella brassicaformis TaxID=1169539 RepID=A0A0G4EW25_VITBC|nr:unnamed protein product [Vitrella brassicaformis CCMP3155]|eukprot:CEM02535.1 unnamed protein product [Vitrella brassicaformis CCMP3155]